MWCLGDHEADMNHTLTELNQCTMELMSRFPQNNFYHYVNKIECKIGNKLFAIEIK